MVVYDQVIFLCKSNTCVSPMAEAIYRAKAAQEMPVSRSRGLVVLFEEPISPKVDQLLIQHHLSLSKHRTSRALKKSDVTPSTLVLTMTFGEKVQMLDDYPDAHVYTLGEYVGEDTDVPDPYGGDEEQYDQLFDILCRRIEKMIAKLSDDNKAAKEAEVEEALAIVQEMEKMEEDT